jgi:hypothetical protein
VQSAKPVGFMADDNFVTVIQAYENKRIKIAAL